MLLDEFIVKLSTQADSKALENFNLLLEKLGVSSEATANSIETAFANIQHELNAFEEKASKGLINITETLNDEEFKAIFGHLGENAKVVASQVDELVKELTNLSNEAEKGHPQAMQSFIDKTSELNQLINLLGEEFKDCFGDIIQSFNTASQSFETQIEAVKASSKSVEENTQKVRENTQANQENKKAVDDASKSLANFILAAVGLDKVNNKFKQTTGHVKSLSSTLLGLSSAIGIAITGVTFFASKSLNALDGIKQLSNVTGETTEYIYRLGKVAENSGASVQAAESSIMALSKAIGEAAVGSGGGAEAFKLYGLEARNINGEIKKTSEVLEDIRQKMMGLSQQEQIALLSKFGLDPSMLQVLSRDADAFYAEMEKMKAMTMGVGTEEDAKVAEEFKTALSDIGKITKSIAEVISLKLAPAITRMIDKFKGWFSANNALIRAGLELLPAILGSIINFITDFVGALDNVISSTIGWEAAFYIVGAALLWFTKGPLLAFNAALLANPFTWIVLGIVAVIALLDDFFVYLRGGESLLGRFWEPFKRVFDNIRNGWKKVVDTFSVNPFKALVSLIFSIITVPFQLAFETIAVLWETFTGETLNVDKIKLAFSQVADWIMKPFEIGFKWVSDTYNKYIAPIIDTISNLSLSSVTDSVKSGWSSLTDSVGNWFSKEKSNHADSFASLDAAMSIAGAGVLNTSHLADNSMTNSNNTYNVTQHISSTSADPKKVADQSARAIRDTNTLYVN